MPTPAFSTSSFSDFLAQFAIVLGDTLNLAASVVALIGSPSFSHSAITCFSSSAMFASRSSFFWSPRLLPPTDCGESRLNSLR